MEEILVAEIELDEPEQSLGDSLEFPCIVLEGVKLEEEVRYLANRKFKEEMSLPLFIRFEGINKKIGKIDVTLDTLLDLNFMKLKIILYKGAEDFVVLEKGEQLENFIKL